MIKFHKFYNVRGYCALFLIVCLVVLAIFLTNKSRVQPTNKPILKVKMLNAYPGISIKDGLVSHILSEKYDLKPSDADYDIVLDSVFGKDSLGNERLEGNNSSYVRIYYTPEAQKPKADQVYDLIFSHEHMDETDSYLRVPYSYYTGNSPKMNVAYNRQDELGECNPRKKKYFACFMVSNSMTRNLRNKQPLDGVIARDRIFHKLSLYKYVASGGGHLNNVGIKIPQNETMEWLSQCKFVIAYENQSYDGYITEKVFNAYYAGAIPIYYGHETAVSDINKKSIIYAQDFKTEDELVDYIKSVDSDDNLYCDIWNQSIITDANKNFEVVKQKMRDKIFTTIAKKLNK